MLSGHLGQLDLTKVVTLLAIGKLGQFAPGTALICLDLWRDLLSYLSSHLFSISDAL